MFSIYSCPKCGRKLDNLALRTLWKAKKWKKVERSYFDIVNYVLATDADVIWFFVFQEIKCYCGWTTIAVHRTRIMDDNEIPLEQKDLPLIHIFGAFQDIDGMYLGKRVKGIIAAFLTRWNRLADAILFCTPFISSKYTTGEWEWLMNHLYPYKFFILTRPQSYSFLKRLSIFRLEKQAQNPKTYGEVSKEELLKLVINGFEENVINPLWASENVYRRKKFHAKYYAGIFPNYIEVIHTSFNLFKYEEQQLENVSFKIYPTDLFFSRFIFPFGIRKFHVPTDATLEEHKNVNCAISYEKRDEFDALHWTYRKRSWEIIERFSREILK